MTFILNCVWGAEIQSGEITTEQRVVEPAPEADDNMTIAIDAPAMPFVHRSKDNIARSGERERHTRAHTEREIGSCKGSIRTGHKGSRAFKHYGSFKGTAVVPLLARRTRVSSVSYLYRY